jgi:glycosyltransferase involved in cell wall biosynthesis
MKKWVAIAAVCLSIGASVFVFIKLNNTRQPYLTVMGRVVMADGIGRICAEVINALKDDVSINFISTAGKINKEDVPRNVKRLLLRDKNQTLGKVVLFQDTLWVPGQENFKKIALPKEPNQVRIAYSMLESTRIPSEWAMILNSYFDAVAVPDPFLVEAFQKSGVKLPIFVVPLGLEMKDFLEQPLKKERGKPMVFANLGTCISRKNHIMLVRAFAEAFGNDPDVVLKINCRYSNQDVRQRLIDEIKKLNLENVVFTELTLSRYAYLNFFKEVDCYVSLSKGEGFSIQPREAMALGIPTIVTDNTAQHTICSSNLVKTVSSKNMEISHYDTMGGRVYGHVFDCDVDEVADALLDVYYNYDKHLKSGPQARDWVRQYEYENLKDLYIGLVKPKKVVLGNENTVTEDCLTTTSQELFEKYQRILKD